MELRRRAEKAKPRHTPQAFRAPSANRTLPDPRWQSGLHWVLDVAFDEDRCRIRRGNGPDNFALLRKIAVNLLKAEKTCKRGVEGKRKHAAWNNDYLLRVLEAGAKLAVQ